MYHYANAVGDGSVLCTTMLMQWVGGSILRTTTVRWWAVVLYCVPQQYSGGRWFYTVDHHSNAVGGGSILCTTTVRWWMVVLYCGPPQ